MRHVASICIPLLALVLGAQHTRAEGGGPDLENPVLVDACIYHIDGADVLTVIDPPFEDASLIGHWFAVRRYEDLPIEYYRIVGNEHFDQWNISVFTVAENIEGGPTPWWYFTESMFFSIYAPLCDPEELVVEDARRVADGAFEFVVEGGAETPCLVQCSNDMVEWTTIATTTPEDGLLEFTDPAPLDLGFRAYRVVME